jgi:hypothetical protein
VTASGQPGDAKQLREEIERTRERLGETVEQLAASLLAAIAFIIWQRSKR